MQKISLHLSSHHRGLCVISLSSKRENLVQGAKGPMEKLQAQLDSKRKHCKSCREGVRGRKNSLAWTAEHTGEPGPCPRAEAQPADQR